MRLLTYLVVDDSPTILKLVSKTIETRLGATKVHQAKDGLEAIAILKSHIIDIIISDWEMPNLSGDQFLYEVRNNKEWSNIPFIMMTTHGEKDFIVTAIQLGVTQYVVKPFPPEELEDKIMKSWNTACQRQSQRYAQMPRHGFIIKIDGKAVPGEIVNISRMGMLVRLTYVDSIKLFATYELALKAESPDQKNTWIIAPLHGKVIRLESDSSSQSSSLTCLMALYFDPTTVVKKVEEVLLDFLKWLNSQGPEIIPAE